VLAARETFTARYPAVAESVGRARRAVAGYAAECGAAARQLDAVRLSVSEALTNAIVHAYPGRSGEIRVLAGYTGGELWIVVSDDGRGLRAPSPTPGLGLGLALIAEVADEFEVAERDDGGTEARMCFRLGGDGAGLTG